MKVKKKPDIEEVRVKINIEQGCELKVFNGIYLEIKDVFYVCEKLALIN